MGRVLRKQKKVDYAKVSHKYDRMSFISRSKSVVLKPQNMGIIGRAIAAPTLTKWPFPGIHGDVEYDDDIDNSFDWKLRLSNEVRLPFRNLSIRGKHQWQGLIQNVNGLSGDIEAQQHFAAIENTLRTQTANTRITEAVGEAAAAICMLTNFIGYEMIWGFHLHSGTGIDQIWRKDCGNGLYDYLIVEAKGPTASVTYSPFVPPNYNQMQEGWVVNHLYSMDKNNHAPGQEIVANLGLAFENAYPAYMGAAKNYYGLSAKSKHKLAGSTVHGMVVTAQWLSDGRLGYVRTKPVRYMK